MLQFGEYIQRYKNLFALAAIQGANAVTPLLIFPFLLITLGDSGYATIAVTEAVAMLGLCFVIYSFDVDAVSKVVKYREESNTKKIEELFYLVLYARIAIFTVVLIVALLANYYLYKGSFFIVFGWGGMLLGTALQSLWFYQAVEENIVPAVVIVFSRLASIVSIFMLVNDSHDTELAVTVIGGGYFLSGMILLSYASAKFSFSGFLVSYKEVLLLLASGKNVFAGNVSVILFRGSNVFILSFFASDSAVSLYSLAEKFTKCIQAVIRPLNQFEYPRLLREFNLRNTTIEQAFTIVMGYTKYQILVLLVMVSVFCVFIFGWGDRYLVGYLDFQTYFLVQLILLVSVFLGVCNYMFGTAGLNNLGLERTYMILIMGVGVVSIITCILLSKFFGAAGAALAYTVGEGLLLLCVLKQYMFNSREVK